MLQAIAPFVPTMVGGAADLVGSTFTTFKGDADFTREHAGRNIHWGIREHAMGVGGQRARAARRHREAVRLDVLRLHRLHAPGDPALGADGLDVVWVFTHDSVAVGEDGPTHQPIEHLAALRAIPGLTVIRPADATETAEAWRVVLEELCGPVCLVLTRQNLPVLDRTHARRRRGRRAGRLRARRCRLARRGARRDRLRGRRPRSRARELLAERGVQVRVVSMPSWELFAAQSADYRDEVLPAGLPKISVEAASSFGWSRWVDRSVWIDTFGASGPGR